MMNLSEMITKAVMPVLAFGMALTIAGCSAPEQADVSKPAAEASTLEMTESSGKDTTVQQIPSESAESAADSTVEAAEPVINEIDLSSYFNGMNGSAVFYTPSLNQYDVYNPELAGERRSPCSTFKIISSLLALQEGVLDPQDSVRQWSGESFWNPEWNQNVDFATAFRTSCVWYYRQLINDLGLQSIQNGLDRLSYGNCDISDWEGRLNTNNNNRELTGFWIESSLLISPFEQAEVMAEIFEPDTEYSPEALQALKAVMLVEQDNPSYQIYGKTGAGKKDNEWVDAWFVGFIEHAESNTYFAVYLGKTEGTEISSKTAREIALKAAEEIK